MARSDLFSQCENLRGRVVGIHIWIEMRKVRQSIIKHDLPVRRRKAGRRYEHGRIGRFLSKATGNREYAHVNTIVPDGSLEKLTNG